MNVFHNAPGIDFCFCETEKSLLSKPSDIIYFPNVPFYLLKRKKPLKQKVFFTIHDLTPLYYLENYSMETFLRFTNFLKDLREEDSFFLCFGIYKKETMSFGKSKP